MNREIKFRFFSPDKRMLNDHDGWVENIGINYALELSIGYGYKIMQFTGRKDKNKKDIYEGDILKSESWGSNSSHIRKSKHSYHIVEWGACGWVAKGYNGEMEVRPDLSVKSDFEIVGNIHQNPELINE